MSRRPMTFDEVGERLGEIPGWEQTANVLYRQLRLPSFAEAVRFIVEIAPLADAMDHHPEIWNCYNQIQLRLWTHDAGGVTELDFQLAAKINGVLSTFKHTR